MGLCDISWLRRGESVDEQGERAIDKIADAICRDLRALGLFVEAKKYGPDFCEIVASSSRKMITRPDGKEASGVALLLAGAYDPPTLVFEEINSLKPGLGRQMVGAVLGGLKAHPGVFERIRVDDASPRSGDGRRWWERVAASHTEFEWVITHDEDRER
ncbi:MAG: hypothetical protein WB816_07215 [Methylocystis sp.]